MEFALSEDQRLLQQSVVGYLKTACPLDTVRQGAAGDDRARRTLAAGLDDLGAPAILVPEADGGLGLGLLEAALVAEALGRACAPAPALGAPLAAMAIAQAGTSEQKAALLPAIARGEARFALALSEAAGARAEAGVTAKGGTLSGTALFALEADAATHVLVAARDGTLHVAEMGARGIAAQTLGTIDRTRIYTEIAFDQAPAAALSAENAPGAALARTLAGGRVLLAADTLGAASHMLEAAVAYAMERKQFGRIIGSFQAVKHLCAEMAARLEPARALVWHAAYALDTGDGEGEVMACLAKAHLAETGTFVARTATEVHGGMGFTDLLGLHHWFKRIGANRQILGGPERARAEAARLQGWA